MYTFLKSGNKYIVSTGSNTDLIGEITAFCKDQGIKCGTITGLGAVDRLTLRYFDIVNKKYLDKEFTGQMEIANLTGNISTLDGELYLHIHIVVGLSDYTALAGHMLSGHVSVAGELVIEDLGIEAKRKFDPEVGINAYDLQ